MATTYCDRLDIESIIGPAAVVGCIDDDGDGQETTSTESDHVLEAIERAAVEMNTALCRQYSPLSALANNAWCKWANAYLACYYLYARRGNPPVASIVEECQQYRQQLDEIRWGRFQVPEQAPTHDHGPAVTNFAVEMGKVDMPIRVDEQESTGSSPPNEVKRFVAKTPGWY